MAKLITALNAYRPRIDYAPTIDTETLSEYVSRRTSLNAGTIRLILYELHDAIAFFASEGAPINLERVGIFRPRIRADGSFRIGFRLYAPLRKSINSIDYFKGRLIHPRNIGLSKEEYIALWNADHPDDLIEAA
ncbi:MAG: hypothetical protein JXA25_18145 [Anaerolineales bacterium]|nr:hypothetical protein [Anaerolineales bacterium]